MELSLLFVFVIVALEWHRFRLEKRFKNMENMLKLTASRASHLKKISHDLYTKMDTIKAIEENFNETREYMVRAEGKLDTFFKDHAEAAENKFTHSDFIEGL